MSICYALCIERTLTLKKKKKKDLGATAPSQARDHKGNNRHSTVYCVDSIFWNSVF